MAAIYLTGITIAMLNIAGIGFVIFMILLNPSSSQLKKANLKKSGSLSSSLQNDIENISVANEQISSPVTGDNNKPRGAIKSKISSGITSGITGTSVAAGAAILSTTDTLNTDKNKGSDFDNIDDILGDLDLSDFDDLDLDDFS
ncbi:MAG: hypothetical protein HQK62_04030 [Desulfamplus sp.]|nr:hypothetical protein [Desulfamplus sp.]